MISLALALPFARAYARHGGYRLDEAELSRVLERRLAALPPWARAHAAAAALFARWLAPAALLGRARRFERLEDPDREALLAALQRAPAPLRALYLGIKAPLMTVCAGRAP